MVHKENGFNQSEKASHCCARTFVRFSGAPTMARDSEVIQRQHLFLSPRRHNLPSKVRLRDDQTPQNV